MNHDQASDFLDRIAQIAGEHCRGFVFAAVVETDDESNDSPDSGFVLIQRGGISLALGISQRSTIALASRAAELDA